MAAWFARRLAGALLVVVIVAALTWVMVHTLRPEAFAFDQRPVLEQFASYMRAFFLQGDLDGYADGDREMTRFVVEAVPQDLQLIAGGMALGILGGVALGAWCGLRPRALVTRALETAAFVFIATPVYVLGLSLILLFGAGVGTVLDLGVLMPAKYVPFSESPGRWLGSMIFPWAVLALPLGAFCLRMTSSVLRESLREPYVRTAEMKGVPPRTVVSRHVLPASVAPVFSLASVSVPLIVTNMVLIEHVFSVPGVFQNLTEAMADENFELLQAMTVVAAALIALSSLLLDVVLAALDPKVRLSGPRSSS